MKPVLLSMLYLLHIFTEVPAVVVGVVGMGHVPGIEKNWDKELNIHEIMRCICMFLVLSNLFHAYCILLSLASHGLFPAVWRHHLDLAGCCVLC